MLPPWRWERRGVEKTLSQTCIQMQVQHPRAWFIILISNQEIFFFLLKTFLATQNLNCKGLEGSKISPGERVLKPLINLHLFHLI